MERRCGKFVVIVFVQVYFSTTTLNCYSKVFAYVVFCLPECRYTYSEFMTRGLNHGVLLKARESR